jgi:cytochrome c-type biogenesis protein
MDTTLPIAVAAGLLSFLSPCVLPLVPPYLTYLAGETLDEIEAGEPGVRRRMLLAAALFVAGFSTVFVALGATASAIGRVLFGVRVSLFGMLDPPAPLLTVLGWAAGVAIIAMGLHFIGLFRLRLLDRDVRARPRATAGPAGAYVMGLAFAFGWTPCIGPVLSTILAVAAVEETVWRGVGLLAAYSLGLGLPFVAAALAAGPMLRLARRFRRHVPTVERVTGGLLVVTGALFLTGGMTTASFWLLETFPALGRLG